MSDLEYSDPAVMYEELHRDEMEYERDYDLYLEDDPPDDDDEELDDAEVCCPNCLGDGYSFEGVVCPACKGRGYIINEDKYY